MKRLVYILLFVTAAAFSQNVYYVQDTSENAGASDANAGTIGSPWATWQKAFDTADKLDTVYFRDGTWYPDTTHSSKNSAVVFLSPHADGIGNDGSPDGLIHFFNYPGETPVLDCRNVDFTGNFLDGINLWRCNYMHFKGLTIQNVPQEHESSVHGISGYGLSNITFENINVNHIGGKGFNGIGAFKNVLFPEQADFPGDTMLFINCDASYCMDSIGRTPEGTDFGNYADGFWWMENDTTVYIEYRGCRSWMNSDDGYDLPALGLVVYDSCWAWDNGHLAHGIGEGIRFAKGIESPNLRGKATNCISTSNKANGFVEGINGGGYFGVQMYNNLAYDNDQWGFVIHGWRTGDSTNVYKNNVSYGNYPYDVGISTGGGIYEHTNNAWTAGKSYQFEGTLPDIDPAIIITDADFLELEVDSLANARQSDGSLPDINFGKLVLGSDMINVGVDVGIAYDGIAPDLGPWEFPDTVIVEVESITVSAAGAATTIETDNGTLQMSAAVLPENASFQNVTWSIPDDVVVSTINQAGLLTAVLDGVDTVRATAQDGTGIYDDYYVTMSNQDAYTLPTVTTTNTSAAHSVQATCGGNATATGGAAITAKGICWNTSENPTTANSYTIDGTGTGAFTSSMTNLNNSTLYYVRAYATNSEGTAYGDNRQVTTSAYSVLKGEGDAYRHNGQTVVF